MNKIKSWLVTGKKTGLILIILCFLLVIGLFLLWGNSIKEGVYVSVDDKTASNLDTVVDTNQLSKLNDIPNKGDPIVLSFNYPVEQKNGPDPDFPKEGTIIQCTVDDINGNGSYYMVSKTDPKTINLFPNDNKSIINSWSNTWKSALSFKDCSNFKRGPTMEQRIV